MQEAFTDQASRFRDSSLKVIEQANAICAEYQAQGYNVNLRQLYYQFVARDLIPNNQKSYKRLGSIINDARLAGMLDWDYVQDETREVEGSFGGWTDPGNFLHRMAGAYSEALWEGQDYRPEVWVEKDALKAIVSRACGPTRTPVFSCRGYVSQSEMYSAAKRFQRRSRQGTIPLVIHLGDHDPSGIDMTRDIRDRLSLMALEPIEVRRIALTMDQIVQYSPPPNPAKLTDSRGESYVDEYGTDSWELDALEPTVLVDLIQDELETLIDREAMDEAEQHEQDNIDRLEVITNRWGDLEDNWPAVLDVIGGQ